MSRTYIATKVVRMCKTAYAGPTDTRGGRVIATHVTTGKRAIVPWDHALDIQDNHAIAASKVLGREPEFCTGIKGGGYMFGVDPSNDPEEP
jgi:hypothetical protein